jgi:multidrug efflux pump subunit AcrA (membrane-fusion protein)
MKYNHLKGDDMNYISVIQDLPQEFQLPLLKLMDLVQRDLRDQLAVRRQDFDELKAEIRELAEAQQRTEQRVAELAEAQQRTEQAQQRTEQRVAELAEAQQRTEEVLRQLLEFQARTEKTLARLEIRQDALVGDQLERRYRERAYAYFGRILRKARAVSLRDLESVLEERLSADELEDLLLLDVLVRGRPRHLPDAPEVWLAIEVSAVVDRNDVRRAQRRAALLHKAGYPVVPAVAGEEVTLGGKEEAHDGRVLLVQDGHRQFWEEALQQALA